MDTHSHVAELRKRYDIRRRKRRVRQVTQAIVQAQATGDPALPALEEELRSLQRDLQREAEAVRELALTPPAPRAPGGRRAQRQQGSLTPTGERHAWRTNQSAEEPRPRSWTS